MKTINETFTDEEMRRLKEVKGNRRWHDAILEEFGVADQRTAVRDGGE